MNESVKVKVNDPQESPTTSSFKIVVFSIDGEEYGAFVEDVVEVIKAPEIVPIPNSADFILGFINIRGRVLSIVDIEKKFGLERKNSIVPNQVLIVDSAKSPFGVLVDAVSEVLEVSESFVQKTPDIVLDKVGRKYVRGVAIINESVGEENSSNANSITSLANKPVQRSILLVNLRELLTEKEKKQVIKGTENE